MENNNIQRLCDFMEAIRHINRIKILQQCKDKPLSITEICKNLNISYPIGWKCVNKLEKVGLVKIVKMTRDSGQPVYVKSLIDDVKLMFLVDAMLDCINISIRKEEEKKDK